VFDDATKRLCSKTLDTFLDQNIKCAFVDWVSSECCVNTRSGHTKGHQDRFGNIISEGSFVSHNVNTNNFIKDVGDKVTESLRQLNEKDSSGERRKFALKTHRELLRQAAEFKEPLEQEDSPGLATYNFTNTCFSCLFGRPEYSLPCGHVICKTCTRDFDQTEEGQGFSDQVVHNLCLLCATDKPSGSWPWTMNITPQLSGIRVLSLDGGGVRGIVELEVMQRLEEEIGLKIPFWSFFDLIVGTSAGGFQLISNRSLGKTSSAKYEF